MTTSSATPTPTGPSASQSLKKGLVAGRCLVFSQPSSALYLFGSEFPEAFPPPAPQLLQAPLWAFFSSWFLLRWGPHPISTFVAVPQCLRASCLNISDILPPSALCLRGGAWRDNRLPGTPEIKIAMTRMDSVPKGWRDVEGKLPHQESLRFLW